jgi:hypothetical protein
MPSRLARLQEAMDSAVNTLADARLPAVFPVGAVYLTAVATNPGTLLGFGTWTQIAHRAASWSARAPATTAPRPEATAPATTAPGRYQVTLTAGQMPAHTHTIADNVTDTGVPTGNPLSGGGGLNPGTSTTSSAGSGQAHENSPPAFGVYVWQRTA